MHAWKMHVLHKLRMKYVHKFPYIHVISGQLQKCFVINVIVNQIDFSSDILICIFICVKELLEKLRSWESIAEAMKGSPQ